MARREGFPVWFLHDHQPSLCWKSDQCMHGVGLVALATAWKKGEKERGEKMGTVLGTLQPDFATLAVDGVRQNSVTNGSQCFPNSPFNVH